MARRAGGALEGAAPDRPSGGRGRAPGPSSGARRAMAHADARTLYPADGYRYVDVRGGGVCVPYPAHLHPEAVEFLRQRFTLREGDVAVATFPKCSTTWMLLIVLLLLRGGEPPLWPPRLARRAPWLERLASTRRSESAVEASVCRLRCVSPGGRCVFKTHARPALAPSVGGPTGTSGRVIIVSRNPKSAAVSAFHHARGLPPDLRFNGGLKEFLGAWVDGLCTFGGGGFWDWHSEWSRVFQALPPGRALWVTFEDLKRDLAGEVSRIASFLGVSAEPGGEVVRRVVEAAGFEAMRAAMTAEEESAGAGCRQVRRGRVHEGRAGGWRDEMPADVASQFDAITLARFGDDAFLTSRVADAPVGARGRDYDRQRHTIHSMSVPPHMPPYTAPTRRTNDGSLL